MSKPRVLARRCDCLPEVLVTDQLLAAPSETWDCVHRPDEGALNGPGGDLGSAGERSATATDFDGLQVERCAHAAGLLRRLAGESLDAAQSPAGEPVRVAVLSSVEALVVAELLDELAGVYPGELVGQLAGSLSGRLWDRTAA
jgi:hypothetical protein